MRQSRAQRLSRCGGGQLRQLCAPASAASAGTRVASDSSARQRQACGQRGASTLSGGRRRHGPSVATARQRQRPVPSLRRRRRRQFRGVPGHGDGSVAPVAGHRDRPAAGEIAMREHWRVCASKRAAGGSAGGSGVRWIRGSPSSRRARPPAAAGTLASERPARRRRRRPTAPAAASAAREPARARAAVAAPRRGRRAAAARASRSCASCIRRCAGSRRIALLQSPRASACQRVRIGRPSACAGSARCSASR